MSAETPSPIAHGVHEVHNGPGDVSLRAFSRASSWCWW